jgi:hypothetical protein
VGLEVGVRNNTLRQTTVTTGGGAIGLTSTTLTA